MVNIQIGLTWPNPTTEEMDRVTCVMSNWGYEEKQKAEIIILKQKLGPRWTNFLSLIYIIKIHYKVWCIIYIEELNLTEMPQCNNYGFVIGVFLCFRHVRFLDPCKLDCLT